jgi:hypothetical protein
VKLIPILVALVSLLGAQPIPDPTPARAVYVVTRATTAESKALFSAKLVKMSATKLHWYDDSSVVRVEISPKALADLQSDPDVALVLPEPPAAYGPNLPQLAADAKPISCASPVPPLPPILPAVAPPTIPNMPLPMAGGGIGMMPAIGNPLMTPALGLADAVAGGVLQKLLNRPASCKISIVKNKVTYTAQGGEGLIEVTASGSCAWQAQASVGWITILSGSGVSGTGIIAYHVAPGEGLARSASIWILPTPGGSPIKGKASQVVTQNK